MSLMNIADGYVEVEGLLFSADLAKRRLPSPTRILRPLSGTLNSFSQVIYTFNRGGFTRCCLALRLYSGIST